MNENRLEELHVVARAMVAPGKGILAADESSGTIKKRFDSIAVESTEESRRDYRELLFRSETAMREHVSGVILYDETIRQKAADGTPLTTLIEQAGSIPGIKVDKGAKPLPGCPGETITEGLDGLRERLSEYYELGARFAKWRAVIDIGDNGQGGRMPSHTAVHQNAQALARYAALCQEANIVPIVEPEVLMDGGHDIDTCYEVTKWVLSELYQELYYARVELEGTILKPNMIVPGKKAADQSSPEEIAEKTVRCFRNTVPAAVPGIVFLSGGQSEVEATRNLDAMNRAYRGELPWALSFSYGRALQTSALKAWSGKAENVRAAQIAFDHRAKMNGLAQQGAWSDAVEEAA
ncbi:class I fructose-bisphosphate aldolase [Parvularcula dongshanensis]|uniref:Fructose-bisphosphate aldolase n=1 Tax=Parvularcula dongshanensis TaxID=1173995 RepID=A0A840I2X2_9PROT|nr:class I fructose-bisphosphate aldolase [Parvularcula dongshanensis]MBB4659189.1 fructose-bisphosphate aldolase class I [Parvularcula dongshanensis]